LIEHDLFEKPLHTFPDHALTRAGWDRIESQGIPKSGEA
jgi:hypothetical protein